MPKRRTYTNEYGMPTRYTKSDVTATRFMPNIGGRNITSFIGYLTHKKSLSDPFLSCRCELCRYPGESGEAYELRILNWVAQCESDIGYISDIDRLYIQHYVEKELQAMIRGY